MKIFIGCDHRGFELKKMIISTYGVHKGTPLAWNDVGCAGDARTDYPPFAQKVCRAVLQNKNTYGILICGSGVGMSIAANRFKKIYAALCWNEQSARVARTDDNANVLVLSSDLVTEQQNLLIVAAMLDGWMAPGTFKQGIYATRLAMLDDEHYSK